MFYLFPKRKKIKVKERVQDGAGYDLMDDDGDFLMATVYKDVWCWLFWCWNV